MSSFPYLDRKETLFKHCFKGLCDQFSSESELVEWCERIDSDKRKDLFIKVASYYAALVKNGDWHVNLEDSDSVVEYITNSYKFISIFSLIESLSELEHIGFYQYLMRKDTGAQFPIEKKDLEPLYRRYNEDHGAIRRCIAFFRGLSAKRQRLLVSKLEVDGSTPSIENFARYLYQLRSNFVHEAKFVHPVSDATWMGFKGDKLTVCSLSLSDAMQFFEEGLLLWFQPKES